jgi:hypothetical protein
VLLLPIEVALHVAGDSEAGFAIDARIRLLGVVRIRRQLRAGGRSAASSTSSGAPHPATPPASGSRVAAAAADRFTHWRERARHLLDRLALVRRVLENGIVRIVEPRGWLEYALADVAETGRLYGFVCASSVLVDPDGAVTVTPLWTASDWLAADLTLAARVDPLRLGFAIAAERLARRRGLRAATAAAEGHPRVG